MVYVVGAICSVNDVISPGNLDLFDPEGILAELQGVETLLEAFDRFGLVDQLDPIQQPYFRDYLESIPPGIQAAALAAARSALARGVRVQLSWQPGYDFELRIGDVTREHGGRWHGLVNLQLVSPHPVEAEPALE